MFDRDWNSIIQKRIDDLGPLPCSAPEMTERELVLYKQLSACVGFLKYLQNDLSREQSLRRSQFSNCHQEIARLREELLRYAETAPRT
jgi:hypothetical protein